MFLLPLACRFHNHTKIPLSRANRMAIGNSPQAKLTKSVLFGFLLSSHHFLFVVVVVVDWCRFFLFHSELFSLGIFQSIASLSRMQSFLRSVASHFHSFSSISISHSIAPPFARIIFMCRWSRNNYLWEKEENSSTILFPSTQRQQCKWAVCLPLPLLNLSEWFINWNAFHIVQTNKITKKKYNGKSISGIQIDIIEKEMQLEFLWSKYQKKLCRPIQNPFGTKPNKSIRSHFTQKRPKRQ